MAEKNLKTQEEEQVFEKNKDNGAETEDFSDLERQFQSIGDRNKMIETKSVLNKNKVKETKEKLLKGLLESLKDNGVDITDLVSINQFLDQLEQQDPDLRELFEFYMNSLMEDSEAPDQSLGEIPEEELSSSPEGLSAPPAVDPLSNVKPTPGVSLPLENTSLDNELI